VSQSATDLPPDFELVIRPQSVVSLADLKDVWRYRELLWTLAMRDLRVRYKQAAFGVAWALLQPLMQMFIFTVLFNRLAGIKADLPVPYRLFCFAGLVVWTWFSVGLSQASDSLIANANVISKVYFPRVVVPLAAVLSGGLDFLIGLGLALVMTVLAGVPLHASVLLALPLGLLSALCAFAFGLWTSAINLQFRDVRYALPFVLQLLIFLTPVFYPTSLLPARLRPLQLANPMAAVVDSFRAALFGAPLPWLRLAVATLVILLVALGGFLYFRRMETTFADRV
jgi:homopolymeric O-antigen transport system permease protein